MDIGHAVTFHAVTKLVINITITDYIRTTLMKKLTDV